MESPMVCNSNSGFTLIETLVVLSIMGITLSLGGTLTLSHLHQPSFQTDTQIILNAIYQSRARAMNNINGSAQSVTVQPYKVVTSLDETIKTGLTPLTTYKVTFEPLTANTTAQSLILNNSDSHWQLIININEAGGINWQYQPQS
jgi:prepilin-type N-terminal cleavage/methylation domain-containing protein